jgi:hypothetical protein
MMTFSGILALQVSKADSYYCKMMIANCKSQIGQNGHRSICNLKFAI